MITPNDIMDRLDELVKEQFPGETTYRNLVEKNFDRPSTLIEHTGSKIDPGFSCNAVEVLDQFTLTTFVEVDPYHNSHLQKISARQMRIVSLFLSGYIKVKGRAPKLANPIETGGGFDFGTVTVTLAYTLDRNDFMNIPQRPNMETLHLNEEVRTHG